MCSALGLYHSIYNMVGVAYDVGDEAGDWISRFTKIEGCRIFYMSARIGEPRKMADHKDFGDRCLPSDLVILFFYNT